MGENGKTICCPVCKTGNPLRSTVCVKCGADLSAAETIPVSHEPTAQKDASTPHKSDFEFVHGQDFGTRYRIIEEIGRGGMGSVYKAYDKELNQVIALKMIHSEYFAQAEAIKRFKTELLLAREITHKNVIRIHDIGEANGIKYFSMAYIDGLNLRDFIRASKKLSTDTAIDIIKQICNGLQAAHEKGILHCDLKSRNIMVDHKGQVYILDFGIARSLLSDESSNLELNIIGTPENMSPEQAQGKPADERSDIYSLGILMYELMTGKMPFSSDTVSHLLDQQINAVPGNPSEFNPDIPPSIEKIILKCLEKNPAARYQSIQEISDALSQVTVPVKADDSKSTLPRWLWGVAVIMVILISISVYFIYIKKAPHSLAPPVQMQANVSPESSGQASIQWKNSIAVLPFKNISSDPNQDYFCDGMTEQLISNLGRLRDLKIIARTSIMLYKNSSKDIRQIAKELNVGNILEGSVRKSGERIRITAQLINAADGSHLWAQDYDRGLKDIFKIQDEVSQKIAESLKVTVENQTIDTAQKTQPQNIDAYNYYLKAKYVYYNKYWASLSANDLTDAIGYAEKSIDVDSGYAIGYAILARLYAEKYSHTYNSDDLQKAEQYANLAYKIGPNLPESLRAMHEVLFTKQDYDRSFTFIKKLIEDDPNDFENNYLLEIFYLEDGMYLDEIKYASRAIELNPLNFDVYSDRSQGYLSSGDKENFIRDVHLCLSIQPEAMTCKMFFAYHLLWINDLQNADKKITELELHISKEKTPQITIPLIYGATKALRAEYFARLERKDLALSIAKNLDSKDTLHFARLIYADLGMAHEAVHIMREYIKTDQYYYSYYELLHSVFYERIRNDPEFQQLLIERKPIYDDMVRKYRIK